MGRPQEWTDERVHAEFVRFLTERGGNDWPTQPEFLATGRYGLYAAVTSGRGTRTGRNSSVLRCGLSRTGGR